MSKTFGLGRGLGSLIQSSQKPASLASEIAVHSEMPMVSDADERILQVSPDRIRANNVNPRQTFDHAPMEELVASIKKHGILQPLIATKDGVGYQLVAGERRLRAAKIAGLKTVPLIVREASELERLELALIENIQRQDLNPIEEARAYRQLMDEFGLTQEEVGIRLGKPRPTVANMLRLLDLPEEMQKALSDGRVSVGHAKVLLSLPNSGVQQQYFKKILNEKLSVQALSQDVQKVAVQKHWRRVTDPNLEAQKDALRRALGTKVDIKKKGDSGTIEIQFFSAEEFRALLERLGGAI